MQAIRSILRTSYNAHLKDYDSFFIITGYEGKGKSNLVLDIIDEWCAITGQEPTIDMIALDQRGWINSMSVAPERVGITVFDEAGDGLMSRDAMSDFNKDVVKMYMVIRGKGLLTIMVLPSFWYLDKYFRQHRVKGLFHVYARGKVAFWNMRQIQKMILLGEDSRDIWCVKPSAYDHFPKYKGPLLDEYKTLKAKKIQETIQNVQNKYNESSPVEQALQDPQNKIIYDCHLQGMNKKQIAEMIGITPAAVGQRFARLAKIGAIEIKVKG